MGWFSWIRKTPRMPQTVEEAVDVEARERKRVEREKQNARKMIVAYCEDDGGHVFDGGYCVGCGCSIAEGF